MDSGAIDGSRALNGGLRKVFFLRQCLARGYRSPVRRGGMRKRRDAVSTLYRFAGRRVEWLWLKPFFDDTGNWVGIFSAGKQVGLLGELGLFIVLVGRGQPGACRALCPAVQWFAPVARWCGVL